MIALDSPTIEFDFIYSLVHFFFEYSRLPNFMPINLIIVLVHWFCYYISVIITK